MSEKKLPFEEYLTPKSKKVDTPKELRQRKIKDIGDWLIWNALALEANNKELGQKNIESGILSILKKQFSAPEETLVAMSKLLLRIVYLQATLKLNELVLGEVFGCYSELLDIEKITNKGGRPIDKELMGVAQNCFERFCITRSRKPTGAELSKLVEVEMQKIKGSRKLDKWGEPTSRKYLSTRNAQEWIPKLALFLTKDSQQELVKSSFN
jgi:hypothetical protein